MVNTPGRPGAPVSDRRPGLGYIVWYTVKRCTGIVFVCVPSTLVFGHSVADFSPLLPPL